MLEDLQVRLTWRLPESGMLERITSLSLKQMVSSSLTQWNWTKVWTVFSGNRSMASGESETSFTVAPHSFTFVAQNAIADFTAEKWNLPVTSWMSSAPTSLFRHRTNLTIFSTPWQMIFQRVPLCLWSCVPRRGLSWNTKICLPVTFRTLCHIWTDLVNTGVTWSLSFMEHAMMFPTTDKTLRRTARLV